MRLHLGKLHFYKYLANEKIFYVNWEHFLGCVAESNDVAESGDVCPYKYF